MEGLNSMIQGLKRMPEGIGIKKILTMIYICQDELKLNLPT